MTTPRTSGARGALKWTANATAFPAANLSFAKGAVSLVALFPYFESDLYTLTPVWCENYKTVGVTKGRVLIMDPEVVAKWTRKAFAFALAHELFHLFVDTHGRTPLGADHGVWNLASDAEINDDLETDKRAEWPWPPVTPKSLKLPDHLTAEAYYAALMARPKPPPCECPCGTGGGNAGDPDKGALSEELDGIFGRGAEEQAADRLALAEAMENAEAKQAGTVPSGMMRHVKALRRPPVTRWQDRLAKLMRGRIANRPGGKGSTYRRPSRKQPGLGYGIGRPVLSTSFSVRPEVWIAIDTSGSMGERELSEGITEARHVLRAAGARGVFLSCDAAVHVMEEVTEHTDLGKLLKGGGGTSFIPVFDLAAEQAAKRDGRPPDLIVFFTDGYGSAPAEDPGIPTIWLLTGNQHTTPAPWGTCIVVPIDGQATAPQAA